MLVLSEENKKDWLDITKKIRTEREFHYVK